MLTPSLKKDEYDNFTWEEIEASLHEPIDAYIQFGPIKQKYLPYGLTQFIDTINANVLPQIEAIEPMVTLNHARKKEIYHTTSIQVHIEGITPESVTAYVMQKRNSFNEFNLKKDKPIRGRDNGIMVYSVLLGDEDAKDKLYYIEVGLPNGEIIREPCEGYLKN